MSLLPPNMDEVNLGFLKRRDPDAEQILGSSAHVTMYIMSVESQKWERRNVEGTLYVVKRRTNPRFQMVVLNKLSTENYVETIESGFHAEVSPPYLIYTQGGGKVHGVWFYEEADLNRIAGLLTKVESGLPKPPILPPEPQAAAGSTAPAPGDDGGFWDKPVHPNAPHTNGPPAMEQPGPTPPNNNAITNLFKNMQVKQQQQQSQPVPQRPESAGPPTASAPAPLPPAFFQQQQQHTPVAPPANKNLDHLRTAAALSPAVSADMAGAGSFSGGDNPISKLFSKQGPPPGAASGLSQSGGGPDNRLAALFNNAKSGAPPSAPVQSASPTSRTPTARQPLGRAPIDERLRSALARLVARDEFLALLSEELRAVGLLAS